MKRKLIQQGGGGYTIYLPKQWVDKRNLKAGEEISIEEVDNSIVIQADNFQEKSIVLNFPKNKKNIKNILTHLYRDGITKITLTNTDPKDANLLGKLCTQYLLGFEITKSTKTSIEIQGISEPSSQKFDTLLRRSFRLIPELITIIKDDLGYYERAEEVEQLKLLHDRIVLFCKRIIRQERYTREPTIYWELLTFLMRILHEIYYFYKFANENNIGDEDFYQKTLTGINDYFQLYNDAFFEKNMDKLNEIFNTAVSMQKDIFEKQGEVHYSQGHTLLWAVLRYIQVGASPILVSVLKEQSVAD